MASFGARNPDNRLLLSKELIDLLVQLELRLKVLLFRSVHLLQQLRLLLSGLVLLLAHRLLSDSAPVAFPFSAISTFILIFGLVFDLGATVELVVEICVWNCLSNLLIADLFEVAACFLNGFF